MKQLRNILISVAVVATVGCASKPLILETATSPTLPGHVPVEGIVTAERALPTLVGNVLQPAHYQHVYIDETEANAHSLQTIKLDDAVKNGVLASSELQVVKLAKLEPQALQWTTFENGYKTPSSIEGVAGFDVRPVNFAEVNFATNQVEILDTEPLVAITNLASRVSGLFYIVGYADVSGAESKNKKLSKDRAQAVADALIEGGVNSTRITVAGAGVSLVYPDLAPNRRATITFKVAE
jgi:outer membrane protein OmpA-like peptidoglycan-associated protein